MFQYGFSTQILDATRMEEVQTWSDLRRSAIVQRVLFRRQKRRRQLHNIIKNATVSKRSRLKRSMVCYKMPQRLTQSLSVALSVCVRLPLLGSRLQMLASDDDDDGGGRSLAQRHRLQYWYPIGSTGPDDNSASKAGNQRKSLSVRLFVCMSV